MSSGNKIIVMFLLLTLLPIEPIAQDNQLSVLKWLIGKWKSESSNSVMIESWEQISSATYEGFGITRDSETSQLKSMETLRLVEMSGEVFYLAKVKHNEMPIPFKLTEITDSVFTFTNYSHDFPQKISYKIIGENRMDVVVGDNEESFTLNFWRFE